MRWIHTPIPAGQAEELSKRAGVGPVLAELLIRGGHRDPAAASEFLNPDLSRLEDPFLVANLAPAAARLRAAIMAREKVVVLGDYDVDGVSSTALLVSVLRRFGLDPSFVVPRRSEDGYGLSRSAIDRALEAGSPGLFVALDCGTNSHEEVEYLMGRGIDVLVVDHHRSRDAAAQRGLLVNPHVEGPGGSAAQPAWQHLCTVGLVFKLLHGLLKQLRAENHPVAARIRLRDYLDLVAMGTIADLVPLLGENRILAKTGLRILQETARPGLRALMEVSGISSTQLILPVDISFRLGPRINASGRLADAALSVDLLLSDDVNFARETAQQLEAFNRERQDIERKITEEAERLIEERYSGDAGIVLFSEAWHPGVVGIVAGRVTRRYNRPCIVLGNEGDMAKGSGRSVDGINLVDVLATCPEGLASWGGHPMAVGVSLPKTELEGFRARFAGAVRSHAGEGIAEARLNISVWLALEQVTEGLMDELDALHPYGQGNPEPVFGLRGVVLRRRPEIFKARHFRFWVEDARGRALSGVAWKMADRIPPLGVPVDLAVELNWNFFNDRRMLQLELVDWRKAS
ncbi:MAG TPA: single-stranded-DNA-specific exonuclease RecJ [Opitutaceae bacterium]|nr:single-stranded-DNA-specific exonuclease RecJ [Opitutaceae bacterium]